MADDLNICIGKARKVSSTNNELDSESSPKIICYAYVEYYMMSAWLVQVF